MSELSHKNFGLLIAYVLPGFVALWGIGHFLPTVESWITSSQQGAPTIGGFLYVTLASLVAGLTVSAVRWAIIDSLHHATGLKPPSFEFSTLDDRLQGFHGLVENHYRYYQFYSNMFVSTALAFAAEVNLLSNLCQVGWPALGFLFLELVFFAGSRDALYKYYARAERLLGTTCSEEGDVTMTNGYDHDKETASKVAAKKTEAPKKPVAKSQKERSDAR